MTDSPSQQNITPLRRPHPCPQCGAPSQRVAYPFCSKRCADLDLGKWLGGSYAIAAVEEDTSVTDTQPLVGTDPEDSAGHS